jgi:ribosomal protein S18 acetylase RimI-like enzyme
MTIGLITRLATTADALMLVALVNSAYRGDSSRAGWTTEADLIGGQRVDIEGLVETIARPGNVILLHERDRVPVACVHLERTGEDCYLGMLTIRPALQGAGLGRQMLEAAEGRAIQDWSSKAMYMTVIVQRTELIGWYERRGYRRTGELRPFPYGDERFGLPRRDDLAFEVLRKPLLRQSGHDRAPGAGE